MLKKILLVTSLLSAAIPVLCAKERYGLPSLTARDAAQEDMTEFFDFANAPWMTPPNPPPQPTNGPCYLDHLP